MLTCSATTLAGRPCGFSARHQTGLCVNHDPAYREQQARNRRDGVSSSTQARQQRAHLRKNTALYNLDRWALVDRPSIQAILDAVIRLELAGRLPNNRARNLIRAISIAVRNFDTPPHEAQHGRTSRHDLARYNHTRRTLDRHLDTLLQEAEARDAARNA